MVHISVLILSHAVKRIAVLHRTRIPPLRYGHFSQRRLLRRDRRWPSGTWNAAAQGLDHLVKVLQIEACAAIQIVDDNRHVVTVLTGIHTNPGDNRTEEIRDADLSLQNAGNRHTDSRGFKGAYVCKNIVQVQHDVGGIHQLVIIADVAERFRHAAENPQHSFPLCNAAEQLAGRQLGCNVVFQQFPVVVLRIDQIQQTVDPVVFQHIQFGLLDHIVRLYLIDQIGICSVLFPKKAHASSSFNSCNIREAEYSSRRRPL